MYRPRAVIVDMDGTLCDVSEVPHLQAERDGFAAFHHAYARCPPHRAVVEWCVEHDSRGHAILIVTGRDASSRELTEQWLSKHLPVPVAGLYMRADDDFRSKAAIKREIHGRLTPTYDIRAAIDDDQEVVVLWQEVGIPIAMVLDGGRRAGARVNLPCRRLSAARDDRNGMAPGTGVGRSDVTGTVTLTTSMMRTPPGRRAGASRRIARRPASEGGVK